MTLGTIAQMRCGRSLPASEAKCAQRIPTMPIAPLSTQEQAPVCTLCSARLRPDIVLFGEALPVLADHLATRALRNCDLFIAVGTSGTVSPASRFVRSAAYAGAHTVLVNLEPIDGPGGDFKEQCIGKADELLPQLFLS